MILQILVPLFALLVQRGESGCPSSCKCESYSVSCISKGLESVPSFESLTNVPAIIDLSGNKLSMIENDDFSFDYSDEVKEVYLNNSEILDIESDAFDELENLQELYLGDNLLNSIPQELIQDLLDVILLDLSGNYFSGDMPRIKSKSLEVLALANSKITNVPDDSLTDLPNLKMLLLQQNNIRTLSPAVFSQLKGDSFFVRLSYNVWDCDCRTYELFEYLADREFIDSTEPYQCLTNESEYEDIFNKKGAKVKRAACKSTPTVLFKKNIEEIKEKPVEKKEQSFSLVKESTNSEEPEKIFIISDNCEQGIPDWTVQLFGFSVNFVIFLIVVVSFLFGTLVGYLLNFAVMKSLDQRLQASESKSKLLPTMDN